jgi:apolipoprotein N-acyltransferase
MVCFQNVARRNEGGEGVKALFSFASFVSSREQFFRAIQSVPLDFSKTCRRAHSRFLSLQRHKTMTDTSEPVSGFKPLTWQRAVLLALIAVICFHLAYTPAAPGAFALGIVGYVICLVQLARLRTKRQCFYVGLATGFACFAPQLGFFWNIFGAAAIALWLVLALWIVFFVIITHIAIAHLGLKRAAFLTPFFWTGLEYFRSELYYLKFSWLNVGYAFAEWTFLPWKFIGVFGIGFLVAALAACFLVIGIDQLKLKRGITIIHILVITLVVWVLCMALLPALAGKLKLIKPTFVASGIQMEFPENIQIEKLLLQAAALPEKGRSFWLLRATNVDLVVLPEYTLQGEPTNELKDWCRVNQKFLIVGGKQPLGDTNYYNTAFVISTNGEVVFKQVKSVPIQFFKDGLPAPEQKVWNSPWGKIGICICYDLSYTRVTDALVRKGAQMLIVPTMDIEEWGAHQHEMHARVAPLRAAEYGIPIFRVASSGISQGVDRRGKVMATAPFPGEGEVIFFGARIGEKGMVPPDRLLASVSVGITGLFLLRQIAVTIRNKCTRKAGAAGV